MGKRGVVAGGQGTRVGSPGFDATIAPNGGYGEWTSLARFVRGGKQPAHAVARRKAKTMNPRFLLIPLALLAALAVAPTEQAQASPYGSRAVAYSGHRHHGARRGRVYSGARVGVGVRVGVPIGRRGGYYREVVEVRGGYHETRTRQVEVRGEQIGWDLVGKPLFAEARFEEQAYRVWIPERRIVRRVWVPRRRRGYVTVGGGVRVR